MAIHNDSVQYYFFPILDGVELLNARCQKRDFPEHVHDTFCITLARDTTFKTKLGKKALAAPPGTISITHPEEIHATPCDEHLGNSFCTFYVAEEAMKTLNNGRKLFFPERVVYSSSLFEDFHLLSECLLKDNLTLENSLAKALKNLIDAHASEPAASSSETLVFQPFIDNLPLERFSLNLMAKQFGMSKYKVIRLFKRETGLTPNNFVLLNRIELSKKFLKQGLPIFESAMDSGFYDVPHFYRYFKYFTGVTPRTYQQAFALQ